jgi:serine/threonine-protein kinase
LDAAAARASWDRFRAEHQSSDPDLFARFLYKEGVLDRKGLGRVLQWRGPLVAGESVGTPEEGQGLAPLSPQRGCWLLGKVGEGAMGRVYVAKDRVLQRKVAFKELSPGLVEDRRLRERFLQEVRITAQLDHPNIVPVYALEVDATELKVGYAMKLVEGRTLEGLLQRRREACRKGDDDEAARLEHLEVLLKVCDALAYAHARGVVHRDLKPANIMVGAFGEVYLMDWGLARVMGAPEGGGSVGAVDSGLTRVGDAVGTPAFMSPEQAQGRNEELDGRSDQYAIGLLLQEVCTLSPAIPQGSVMEAMAMASLGRRAPFVHAFGATLAPELAAITLRACAPEPTQRYPSVKAIADDLRRFLRGRQTSVLPFSAWRRFRRWVERYSVLLLSLLLSGALAASGVAFASLAGLQWVTYRTADWEQQVTRALAAASAQAHLVDVALLGHLRRVERLSASGALALAEDAPTTEPPWLAAQMDAGELPDDYAERERWGAGVSLREPAVVLAPGVDPGQAEEGLRRLGRLRRVVPDLFQPAVESGVVWAFLGTADGLHLTWPGHGGYPTTFDPRKRPWYRLGEAAGQAVLGTPYTDVNGVGLMVPCVAPVRGPDGQVLGVAGVDLAVDYLVEDLLDPAQVPGSEETLLLDRDGNVVARSGDRRAAGASGRSGVRLARYEREWVATLAGAAEASVVEEDGARAVLVPLQALPWWFVAVGPAEGG